MTIYKFALAEAKGEALRSELEFESKSGDSFDSLTKGMLLRDEKRMRNERSKSDSALI